MNRMGAHFDRLRYWNDLSIRAIPQNISSCNSTYRLRYWNCILDIHCMQLLGCDSTYRLRYWNLICFSSILRNSLSVATVLTVYGIETLPWPTLISLSVTVLQQYLPFTVLKHFCTHSYHSIWVKLQQYLPLAIFNRLLQQKPRVD